MIALLLVATSILVSALAGLMASAFLDVEAILEASQLSGEPFSTVYTMLLCAFTMGVSALSLTISRISARTKMRGSMLTENAKSKAY